MVNNGDLQVKNSVNLQTKKEKTKDAIREICQKFKVAKEQNLQVNPTEFSKLKSDALDYYNDFILDYYNNFLKPSVFFAFLSAFFAYFFIYKFSVNNYQIVSELLHIKMSQNMQFFIFVNFLFVLGLSIIIALRVVLYDLETNKLAYIKQLCGACCDKKTACLIYQLLTNKFDKCVGKIDKKKIFSVVSIFLAIFVISLVFLNFKVVALISFLLMFCIGMLNYLTDKEEEKGEEK